MRNSILACALTFALCHPVGAAEWKGTLREEDGVAVADNPAEPMEETETLVPEELFRLGGEDEIFGTVTRIVVDEDDNTYLLDSQLNEIRVFDPQGGPLRTFGREGEAPGEFRMAFNMLRMPDRRLAVVQTFPARLVMLDYEGQPLDDHPLPSREDGGFQSLLRAESAGDQLVLELTSMAFDKGSIRTTQRVVSVNDAGEETHVFGERTQEQQMGRVVLGKAEDGIPGRWTLGPDGRLYAAPLYHEYRLEIYSIDGALERVLRRSYEPLPMTDEDVEALKREVTFSGNAPQIQVDADPWHRDIDSFYVRDNGEIWVLSSRGAHIRDDEGGMGLWDVFDEDGRFVRQVRVDVAYDDEKDGMALHGKRLYILRNQAEMVKTMQAAMGMQSAGETEAEGGDLADEDVWFEIVCYRLPYVTGNGP